MPTKGLHNAVFLLFVVATICGCQTMMQNPQSISHTNEMVDVRIRPAYGKAKNQQIPLQENMRLQDVVDNVRKGFSNSQAYIVRTSPLTGEQHKLEGQFDNNGRISLQTDYAIQPGDRIVIMQDTSTSFDRVMKSVLGQG